MCSMKCRPTACGHRQRREPWAWTATWGRPWTATAASTHFGFVGHRCLGQLQTVGVGPESDPDAAVPARRGGCRTFACTGRRSACTRAAPRSGSQLRTRWHSAGEDPAQRVVAKEPVGQGQEVRSQASPLQPERVMTTKLSAPQMTTLATSCSDTSTNTRSVILTSKCCMCVKQSQPKAPDYALAITISKTPSSQFINQRIPGNSGS